MIPSNYFREEFYHYTAEADKNIYVVMQVRPNAAFSQFSIFSTYTSPIRV